MHVFSAEETRRLLPYPDLIVALKEAFQAQCQAPLRHHHNIAIENQVDASLLLMPAWSANKLGGVKIVNVNPGNATVNLPAIAASYLLFDVQTGEHLAIFDGAELTTRRTAAASALAASYLANETASSLLIVGSGAVASQLALAYQSVRPINEVRIWSRNSAHAQKLSQQLQVQNISASVAKDLEAAVGSADIISCATLAETPIIKGHWLQAGQHLDLIGSFTPDMREADDAAVQRARVFIDTDAALNETGDIIGPIGSGVLRADSIAGDLHSLCRGHHAGRSQWDDITLFKSVGSALEDLAAASLAITRARVGRTTK
jgi:ornithine cyclodeaminase/alanine dehydrogenase-like protein (mu-crystallin family)